ncbi:DUF349 domain-containing protein [Halomonas rhizosphaerae]|uniref:DUF349 domain-containing protein n=1 Tax=Halomonas rhizosphaerae TaxID=3043296 RepID=A0ABT6UVK9_9GAMM|nr:DUF349 domain-containing protein [Halomonas rhizosphaerae]MDI5889990.1 DUF349 domain-containing protein [Halomonas rhizosphaerae]
MSGLLRRLFAPRWKHPDPEVRRQAVARLDPARDDQRRALEQLALDPDPGVREAALAHLEDPERLLDLCREGDAPPELRRHLVALLAGRHGQHDLPTRIALVERLEDPELLNELALQGDNLQLRLAALARLEAEEDLIRQACDNGIAAVRHAAAARVESEAGLSRLAHEARRDRQVARKARERLNRLRADAASLAAARERREALLETLEQHAGSPWEPLYAGRFRHLMREWTKFEDLPDARQERRYQDACLRCRKVIGDHEAQEHARDADHRQRESADQTREALIEALEESLEGLHQGDRLTDQDIASLRAHKRLLATRWQALSDHHLADEALRERYDRALAACEGIVQARVRLDERAEAIEQALADGDDERLEALVEACGWPQGLAPAPLLQRARQRIAAEPPRDDGDLDARLSRFVEELDQLERLLESGAFKGASRLHQRLRQQADQLPQAPLQPHQARLKRLAARLAELRDWRGFVAGPKRDQLCLAIEGLADTPPPTEAELDRRHRQLVKEWKALGDAAANREQSARFRAASDRIHERLAPWRERQLAERQRNLEAREALCEQLETLLEQPAHEADPDALREIRDRSREQWRRFAPVPREEAETIGRRFGRIRHDLQALIDRRAREIAEAKRDMIEQTRELLARDMPASKRADQAKALQRRWRELGRAPKGEEQALWREFRSLCDDIFASREAARDDQVQRNRARLDAMQALIDRLDSWHPSHSREASVLDEAVREATALEPLPSGRRSEGMRRRWSGIVRARRERLARLSLAEEAERWQAIRPLLNAHLQADARRLAGGPVEEVALPDGLALPSALRDAHERRNAARRGGADDAVEERLARLRAHLSLLAGGRVNQRDDPLRLAIQVERLNDSLGQQTSRAEELHQILADLLATGPMPEGLWEREVGELDRMLESLAELPPP